MRIQVAIAGAEVASWPARSKRFLLAALLIVATGCAASPASQGERAGPTAAVAPARSGPKSSAIAFPIDRTSLAGGMQGVSLGAVPGRSFKECPNAFLTT